MVLGYTPYAHSHDAKNLRFFYLKAKAYKFFIYFLLLLKVTPNGTNININIYFI